MIETFRTGSALGEHADDRVAALVGRAAAVSIIITRRSAPRTIRSSASAVGLLDHLVVAAGREEGSLVDEVARSAPTIPGVVAAIRPRSTSGASGRRAYAPSGSPAAGAVGRLHGDAAVEAARSEERRVEHVRRLVAPITITFVDESKPSISVRIWLSVARARHCRR